MKIMFVNRITAEKMELPADSAMISITTPGDDLVEFLGEWAYLHRVVFFDSDEIGASEQYPPITMDQANALYDFLKSLKIVNPLFLIVHCDGGISRSAAVAKFAAEYFDVYFNENYSLYNRFVFRALIRVMNQRIYGSELIN